MQTEPLLSTVTLRGMELHGPDLPHRVYCSFMYYFADDQITLRGGGRGGGEREYTDSWGVWGHDLYAKRYFPHIITEEAKLSITFHVAGLILKAQKKKKK